jgi:hypothetical protein
MQYGLAGDDIPEMEIKTKNENECYRNNNTANRKIQFPRIVSAFTTNYGSNTCQNETFLN